MGRVKVRSSELVIVNRYFGSLETILHEGYEVSKVVKELH